MLWINTTVGEFCPFVYGKAIKKQDQLRDGYPVYGSNGMYTHSAKKLAGPYAVIIGRKGSVGKIHLSLSSCWVSDTAFYVQYDSLEEAYFTYYLVSTLSLESMNTDAAVPGLNRNNAHRLSVRIPEKPEDRKELVSPLIDLDKKIQLNHQINQTLEQMIQAIFKSWFVDFEPVKAKITTLEAGGSEEDARLAAMQAISSKPADALTRLQAEQPEQYAKLCATAELFPSAMQDSELGEIPEGWMVSPIGTEVEVKGGGTPPTKNSEYWDKGAIHWSSPKDLSSSQSKVMISTERKITEAGLNKISSGLLPKDTVLMSSRAPVGYLAIAKIPVAINQGYIGMVCKKRLQSEYVIQWAASVMDDIKQRSSGTTFSEISKKNFRTIPVLVPSHELISHYCEIARAQYSAIELNLRNSNNLSEIRNSLLPQLLFGKLEA